MDPADIPKKPPSAYLCFVKEHRPKLRNQDSGLSFGELGRKLGADWKDLNEAQRRPYQDEADRLMVEYKNRVEEYEAQFGKIEHPRKKGSKSKTKKKRMKKDPLAPKRPPNAYMCFVKDRRAEIVDKNPNCAMTDIAKKLGACWADMKDAEKAKYEQQAKAAKDIYQEQLATYEASKN